MLSVLAFRQGVKIHKDGLIMAAIQLMELWVMIVTYVSRVLVLPFVVMGWWMPPTSTAIIEPGRN